jgi:demethylmenaquinone methyltransferase / 2-methoxy-6-polyprenyl-1,4-benzoquinol methylase
MEGPTTRRGPAAAEVPDRRFVAGLFAGLAPRYNSVLLAYSFGQDLRWKEVLLRHLRPTPGERALDLACGTGLILDRLSKVLGASHTLGADINRSMLLEMRRARTSRAVVQSDAERLPLTSGVFDIVTAGYLLKYVNLERFARELARVMRPGGRFGGYDFSRPIRTTPTGRLYAVYLHRLLPRFGRGRGSTHPDGSWRSVFDFLPEVAEGSGWEDRIRAALEGAGLGDVEIVPSLGGAITWVWARKPAVESNAVAGPSPVVLQTPLIHPRLTNVAVTAVHRAYPAGCHRSPWNVTRRQIGDDGGKLQSRCRTTQTNSAAGASTQASPSAITEAGMIPYAEGAVAEPNKKKPCTDPV